MHSAAVFDAPKTCTRSMASFGVRLSARVTFTRVGKKVMIPPMTEMAPKAKNCRRIFSTIFAGTRAPLQT